MSRILTASALFLAALAACTGNDGGPSGPPDPSPRPSDGPDSTVLTRPARPLAIPVTLDRQHAARAYVTTAGGTIIATGADGTRYTLTIPPDGLFEPDTISAIPVLETAGRRVGADGPAAAVQFEPEGLRFVTPASLRIDPAVPIPLASQVSLGWHGAGQDVHLEPLDLPSRDLVMPILHFSGAAVGMVYLGDGIWGPKADWADYTPREFEDRARQYLQELTRDERQRVLTGEDPDPEYPARVKQVMQKEWELVIKPILDRAATDCDYANENLYKVLSFGRTIELVGATDVAPELMSGVVAAADNCWKQQKSKCRMADDAARMREIFRIMRTEALIGRDPSIDEVPICGDTWTGSFEANVVASAEGAALTINGTVTFKRDRQVGLTEYYKPSGGTLSWKISGPHAANCRVSGSGTATVKPGDGTLEITRGVSGVTTYTGFGSSGFVADLTISCPDRQYVIPSVGDLRWFNPPRTPLSVAGAPTTITGSNADITGSWNWNLQVQ